MEKLNQQILLTLVQQPAKLNCSLVTSYIKRITNQKSHLGFLNKYYNEEYTPLQIESLEDCIEIFELAIPTQDKIKNGAIYTPSYIRDYIVRTIYDEYPEKFLEGLVLDPACGCGAFLVSVAQIVKETSQCSYATIFKRLYGIDISILSIERAKILLGLLALTKGEIIEDNCFNLYCANSLSFNFYSIKAVEKNGGFDVVVGNPPYVRSKNIDSESKMLLNRWKVAEAGNADLYIPFFEIALKCLKEDGVMGYITLNSFFKSVNARALRSYFNRENISLKIIDFGDELVFAKKLAYTCIVFCHRSDHFSIDYTKCSPSSLCSCVNNNIQLEPIDVQALNHHKGWNLNSSAILSVITQIENIGKSLGERYAIKNGIATLANDIYIFRPCDEDEKYYYVNCSGLLLPIEKDICRDIIKPNILHSEDEIPSILEKVIFPYNAKGKIINEAEFVSKYPKAYQYLLLHRSELDARDKGDGNFARWYAFGRTQAILDKGKKLLFPYMTDVPHFVFTDNEDMLIYCGYAIFSNDETELLILKKILESSVFSYYMRHTSKPYATGYLSYAKNYVKNFGIPNLSLSQRCDLISMTHEDEINEYVETLYGVDITSHKCIKQEPRIIQYSLFDAM